MISYELIGCLFALFVIVFGYLFVHSYGESDNSIARIGRIVVHLVFVSFMVAWYMTFFIGIPLVLIGLFLLMQWGIR